MRSIVSNHRAIERRMNRRMEEKKEKQFRLPLFADTHIHCISDTIYSACGTRTKTEIEGIEPNAETRHTAKTVIMMSNKNILLYYIRWLISLQRGVGDGSSSPSSSSEYGWRATDRYTAVVFWNSSSVCRSTTVDRTYTKHTHATPTAFQNGIAIKNGIR